MQAPLFERLGAVFRCPGCRNTLEARGEKLVCGGCALDYPFQGGILDFLESAPERPSWGQRFFFSSWGARAYASLRQSPFARLSTGRSFPTEVSWLCEGLGLRADHRILDVPCGQGNFTLALAARLPLGYVVGVDLSMEMLRLARGRIRDAGLRNVVLVRASAQDLPLHDGAFDAVSSCGGLHLYPEPPRAIAEMARVVRAGSRVAGLTFRSPASGPLRAALPVVERLGGVRAFDFDALGGEFAAAGFGGWRWEPGGILGYFTARRG